MKSAPVSIFTNVLSALSLTIAFGVSPMSAVAAQNSDLALRRAHLSALDLAQAGNTKVAISRLRDLSNGSSQDSAEKVNTDELDRVQLSLGRLLYQGGDFDGAIEAYARVQKNGASWLESLEEQAWAEFRSGRTAEAVARLKTVTSPAFKTQVGAEPYFLLALSHLRTCDHKALFKSLDLFKDRFRDRIKNWQSSAVASDQARLSEVAETIQKLNLVEAEAIQRLYMDEDGKSHGSAPKVEKQAGQLSFPHEESDEVWLDEVDGFKVSQRGCPIPSTTNATVASTRTSSRISSVSSGVGSSKEKVK